MLSQNGITITLEGEIDISREHELERALEPAEWAERATLDFSHVSFASTTLINAVIRLHNQMRGHGRSGAIRIVGCTPHIKRVLSLARLDTVFDIV